MGGTLQTRTMLATFGCEEVEVVHGEEEDQSAGRLVEPKFPDIARDEEQGPSSSRKGPKREDGQEGRRQSEEPMQHDLDQAEKEDDKASTGGMSSLLDGRIRRKRSTRPPKHEVIEVEKRGTLRK